MKQLNIFLISSLSLLLPVAASAAVGDTFKVTVNNVETQFSITAEGEKNTCSLLGTYRSQTKKYYPAITTTTSGTYSIPSTVTYKEVTYNVTGIGPNSFFGCELLEEVEIPSSVVSIGASAFSNCTAITKISADNFQVESIGENAFNGCTSLTTITLPESLTSLGELAFNGCSKLETITNSSKIQAIEKATFLNCSKLSSFTINNEVKSVGEESFKGCTSLSSLTMGENVEVIGANAFMNCSSLSSFTIPASVTSIGTTPFTGCTNLATINVKTSTVTSGLFSGCTALTAVNFEGGSLTRIPSELFKDCASLTSITLPEKVTYIEQNAFENCTGLTSFSIPASVKTMLWSVFKGCTNLKSVTFGDDSELTSIPDYTFQNCSKLSSITVPSNVSSIGRYAFNGCSSLTGIDFVGKLTSVDVGAFQGCSGLTSLTIPEGLTSIGSNAFADCSNLTSLNVPSTIVTIGDKVFKGLSSLTSLNLPNATSMGESAFAGCTGLTEVLMPKMETIGANAFEGCTGLTTLTLPSTITSIGLRAFKDCTNMVYIDATAATSFSPANATRDYVFGQDSPFWEMNNDDVVIYLADGVSPANCSPNVVLTSGSSRTCPDFQFNIANLGNLPYGFTATNLKATGLSISGKQGLYLPFSIDAENAAVLGALQKVTVSEGVVALVPATTVEANTPYLLTPAATPVTTITAANSEVKLGETAPTEGFIGGTGEAITAPANTYTWDAETDEFKAVTSGEKVTVPLTSFYYVGELTATKPTIVVNPAGTEITIGAGGYSTFCSSIDVDFSGWTDVKAWVATGYNNGNITMQRVMNAEAGMGVLLSGEEGATAPVVAAATGEVGWYSNLMKGVLEQTKVSQADGSYTNFYLTTTDDDGTGFFKVASAGITIGAGKAYLQLPTTLADKIGGSAAPSISLIFDDETTGISETVDHTVANQSVFDLQGRRVAQPQKGLYIVNGKKVVFK